MHNLIENHRVLLSVAVAIVLAAIVLLIIVYSGGGHTSAY